MIDQVGGHEIGVAASQSTSPKHDHGLGYVEIDIDLLPDAARFNVGDRREMLGSTGGLLVAPGDAGALADGLIEMLASGDQHVRRAELARRQAATYRWGQLANEWLKVYERH